MSGADAYEIMAAVNSSLLERARSGDRPAIIELLHVHDADLRRFLQPRMPQRWQHLVAVDDVIQQTYTDILLKPAHLPEVPALPAWLRRCAVRNLIDLIRMLEAADRNGQLSSGAAAGRNPFDPLAFVD